MSETPRKLFNKQVDFKGKTHNLDVELVEGENGAIYHCKIDQEKMELFVDENEIWVDAQDGLTEWATFIGNQIESDGDLND